MPQSHKITKQHKDMPFFVKLCALVPLWQNSISVKNLCIITCRYQAG